MGTKILLIGEYYSENLGDPLLCQTVEKCIKEHYPNCSIVPFDLSGKISIDSYYTPTKYSVAQKVFFRLSDSYPFLFKFSKLFHLYKEDKSRHIRTIFMLQNILSTHRFDIAVFAGGSILMDYFAGIIYCIVKMLEASNIKVIFHACGISVLSKQSTGLLQKALKSKTVKSVSLRDSIQHFSDSFATNYDIVDTYDTALLCSNYYRPASTKIDLGIGVIANKKYYNEQRNLIKHYLSSETDWKIFTNGSPADYNYAKIILSDLGVSPEEADRIVVPTPKSVEQLISNVTSFNKIISFRLHSQIIASSYGIPSVGFIWDPKIIHFYTKLGFPNNSVPSDASIQKIESSLILDRSALIKRAAEQGMHSKNTLIAALEKHL